LRRADREKFWEELKKKYDDGDSFKVKVITANKGGLMVETSGVRGFLPVSQLNSEHYPRVEGGDKRKILEKLNSLLNTTLEVKIITFDKDKNNLIFSEKAAGDKIKEDTISGLKVGSQIKGAVSGIIDFGIFVRFNDIEGLVHISEVAWEKIEDLNKLFKIGDQVDAEIISISGNKVSLSLKRLKPDLWAKSAGKYKQDQVIEGPITRVVPYGVFVKLNPQIEALAHISDLEGVMPEKRGLSELFEIDKKYTFKILKIDKEQHKIALKWVPDKKSK
jgi:small subunit ribosomal protein S1